MIIDPALLTVWAQEITEIAESLVAMIKTCKLESTQLTLGSAHNALRRAADDLGSLAERLVSHAGIEG